MRISQGMSRSSPLALCLLTSINRLSARDKVKSSDYLSLQLSQINPITSNNTTIGQSKVGVSSTSVPFCATLTTTDILFNHQNAVHVAVDRTIEMDEPTILIGRGKEKS